MRQTDYIEDNFIRDMQAEVERARAKFPSSALLLAVLTEKTGELAKALLHRREGKSRPDVWTEAVQLASIALRVATEGDSSFDAGE